jgi:hypothetical protein
LLGDTTATWAINSHKILLKNEPGIELLENGKAKIKIGDGVKSWGELPYFGDEVNLDEVWSAIKQAQENIKALQDVVGKLSVASGTVLGLVKSSTEEKQYFPNVFTLKISASFNAEYILNENSPT